jgi:5-methylthioadenosine/S-adenosylhomocysteine deaminase
MYKDPSVLSAYDVLKMATINGAKALGINNLGLIKKGYKADIIIVELKDKPINNELVALLTNNVEVKCTIIDGNVLYNN